MIRKSMGISRSLLAVAVLAAAFGCKSDSAKDPGQQLQSPTTPLAGISVTIGASRSRLQVGDNETTAVITVQALRTADWSPLANGTDAVFNATLGAIDSPAGARSATVDLVGGKAAITLYAGGTEGTARVTVTIQGVSATLNITIDPAGIPGPPAPTAATLNFVCSPSFFDEDAAAPYTTTCTATVLGSDGDPFSGASIYLTSNSGFGTFGTSGTAIGDAQTTNGAGQVSDTLTVATNEALTGFPGSSFGITAHMGVTGGERTANFTVSIVTGSPPAAATNLQCFASSMFVTDDGGDPPAIDIDAIVYDQYFVQFGGATVLFSSTLGTPSPASAMSNGSGLASSSLDLSAADVATHPTDSFTITAKVNSGSGVVSCPIVVTIDRVADSEASSVVLNATSSTTIFEDSGTETVDLDALVRDQFTMPLDGVVVDFGFGANGSPGTITPASEETGAGGTNVDATGHATATFSATEANIEAFPTDQFTITAKVVTSGGTVSAVPLTVNISRTPLPALIADFTYVATLTTDVDFTDTSTGSPTAWRWDFDNDGSVDSTAQNPSDVDFTPYGGAGTYMVKLTVLRNSDGGSDTVIKSVIVP